MPFQQPSHAVQNGCWGTLHYSMGLIQGFFMTTPQGCSEALGCLTTYPNRSKLDRSGIEGLSAWFVKSGIPEEERVSIMGMTCDCSQSLSIQSGRLLQHALQQFKEVGLTAYTVVLFLSSTCSCGCLWGVLSRTWGYEETDVGCFPGDASLRRY